MSVRGGGVDWDNLGYFSERKKTEGEIRLLGRDYKAPTSPPHKSIPNLAQAFYLLSILTESPERNF